MHILVLLYSETRCILSCMWHSQRALTANIIHMYPLGNGWTLRKRAFSAYSLDTELYPRNIPGVYPTDTQMITGATWGTSIL